MAKNNIFSGIHVPAPDVKYYGKIIKYPGGFCDLMASEKPIFSKSGFEKSGKPSGFDGDHQKEIAGKITDIDRSMRRAKANLRRLALANDFRWFVTLTLDPQKVDTHDGNAVVKKLNVWCSNMVQRYGLKYILVPERHKKGGIHFHGFFSDCLNAVPSGHFDKSGHPIFNLPQWSLGFTTAIELYDDYQKAVGYVCKYIGKQGEKPAGRWYYSGGDLKQPEILLCDLSPRDLLEAYPGRSIQFEVPGNNLVIVNGVKEST